MKSLPATPDMLRAAKRIIWFKAPEEALRNPVELLAYAMKHSTDEDLALLIDQVGMAGICEALDNAPPGIIGERSWVYWNAKVGRFPPPPMPQRRLPP